VNRYKKSLVLIFSALFVLTAVPAFAHKTVIEPDKFTAQVGESVGLLWNATEVIGTPQYSLSATEWVYPDNRDMEVVVVYKDGTTTEITELFKDFDSKIGEFVEVDIDTMKFGDSSYAEFTVEKSGTVVVESRFDGTEQNNPEWGMNGATEHSYVKTFLNLTNDGTVTKRTGGDKHLEIVFAEDILARGIRVGDKVKFKLYLLGKPLNEPDKSDPEIFATYSGAPSYFDPEEDADTNDYITDIEVDENGEIEIVFDHEGEWLVGTFALPDNGENYFGGVMFNVASKGSDDGGSSGCNAGGVGALVFLVLAAGLKIKK
jgi:uncharacterized GH25 family protein